MEVYQIFGVGFQSLQIEDRDVLLEQFARNLAYRRLFSCLDRSEAAVALAGRVASHEVVGQRGRQFAEFESQ